jgi:hypothetical protein
MYRVANGFDPADEACEEALYDVALFRGFCGSTWDGNGSRTRRRY